jgi:hypothetical protein
MYGIYVGLKKEKLFKHMVFMEPACDGQHGYRLPSVNSGFIDIQIYEPMLI